MARLGPSGLAQLFREIANYVSKRLSDYRTKAELDTLLDTKANDDNVVHKSGAETINGIKTFTSGLWVTNSATTNGYSIKLNALARNEVPSELYHATFRTYDKNNNILGEYCVEKSTTGDSLLNMNVRSEDSNGTQIAHGLQFRMTNDGSVVRFIPTANNKVHLGDVNAKWLKVHSDDVVHTSGDEYIHGIKRFSGVIHRYADLTTNGDAQVYRFDDTNANACGHIYNNAHWYDNAVSNGQGAYNNKSGKTMEIEITSNDAGVGMAYVSGSASKGNLETATSATGHTGIATMGWVNNPATSTNVVHRTGNETISGVKSFNNLMYIYDNMSNKNSQMDLFTTPANTLYSHYMFVDKNNEVSAYMQYGQQNTGTDFIGLFIHDKNRSLRGIQVTTNNEVIPLHNNTYSLGSVSNKWANVYTSKISFPSDYYIITDANDNSLRIIRDGTGHGNNYKVIIQGDTGKFHAPNGFIGNLQGNADTATSAGSATKASYLDSYSSPGANKIYLDWSKQVNGYVGLKVDDVTMGGLITTTNLITQTNTLCSSFASGIRFGGVGCIKLLAFEWGGYNKSAYSLYEGTTYAGANLRHIVFSISGFSTIPDGSDTIYNSAYRIYLGTRPSGTWALLSSFNAFTRSYHPETCVGLFVRIA